MNAKNIIEYLKTKKLNISEIAGSKMLWLSAPHSMGPITEADMIGLYLANKLQDNEN